MGWTSLTARPKALGAEAVTPHDAEDITATSGLYVGVAGNVTLTLAEMDDGDSITFVALAAGVLHPLVVKRVWATGTDATDILAVY